MLFLSLAKCQVCFTSDGGRNDNVISEDIMGFELFSLLEMFGCIIPFLSLSRKYELLSALVSSSLYLVLAAYCRAGYQATTSCLLRVSVATVPPDTSCHNVSC